MKRNFTGNQRGEIVTGVMVVMMVAMMIFGGMSMMHGGHRHADRADHQDMKAADKQDHQKEAMHEKHNHNTEDSSGQDGEAKDHMRCM